MWGDGKVYQKGPWCPLEPGDILLIQIQTISGEEYETAKLEYADRQLILELCFIHLPINRSNQPLRSYFKGLSLTRHHTVCRSKGYDWTAQIMFSRLREASVSRRRMRFTHEIKKMKEVANGFYSTFGLMKQLDTGWVDNVNQLAPSYRFTIPVVVKWEGHDSCSTDNETSWRQNFWLTAKASLSSDFWLGGSFGKIQLHPLLIN